MIIKLPSKEILDELLLADFETGKLYWKERDAKWFKDLVAFKRWNNIFSGVLALNSLDTTGYFVGRIFYIKYKAHRIIYKMYYGIDPNKIDHINGIKTDNRIINLRSVTQQENCKNRSVRKNSNSGVQGLTWDKKSWRARITNLGKTIYLGNFDEIEKAKDIIKEKSKELDFHQNHGRK